MPPPEQAAQPRWSAAAWRRRGLLALTALAVPLAWTMWDIVNRSALLPHLQRRNRITYATGAALSLALWAFGMEAARHPRRAVRLVALALLGFTAALGIGGQTYFHSITNEYVSRDAVLLAADMPGIISGFASSHALRMAVYFAVPAIAVVALAVARARRFGVERRAFWPTLAGVAALGALIAAMSSRAEPGWYQALPPDMLWVHASGGPFLKALGVDFRLRSLPVGRHEAPPPAAVVDAEAPTIVLILGESIRRDEVCVARTEGCTKSPAVDAAAPARIGYERAFSVASCTELVSTVLWSGLSIKADLATLSRAPLLWDYAKARGYRTAYLTSQNLGYQHVDMFLRGSRIDLQREARDRLTNATLDEGSPDELLGAEAVDFIEKSGPSLVVVHLSNTHGPYRQVPGYTPYSAAGGLDRVRADYRNSIVHDDAVVGDFLARLRRGERGRRAVVVALSDHGEAWNEHHALGHTFDVYGEEIDVPLWIDAPEGSLPPAVIDRLRTDAKVRPVVTADVGATILDLLGALDAPTFHEHAEQLAGTSLLREPPPARDLLLWNCPVSRWCPAEAFGVINWPMKLHYVGRELHYACHDLEADPGETTPLPAERCAPQRAYLDKLFSPRPEVAPR